MKLYHYMDRAAYDALLAEGTMIGRPEHSPYPEFADAYGWLAGEMCRRIGPPPSHANAVWPVFSWHSYGDMSPVSHDRDQPENGADFLVGFEVPEGLYMLSDFDDFHFVLNNWYLPSTGSDGDETASSESDLFDAMCAGAGYDLWTPGERGPDASVEEMRRRHWCRVVDLPMLSGTVQATTWELRSEWVFFVRARRHTAIPGLSSPTRAKRNPVVSKGR